MVRDRKGGQIKSFMLTVSPHTKNKDILGLSRT